MNFFTIKDLENLSGIKAHTIRIWEQRYSFLKPKRSDTNIRFYESDELKTLLNIALLNRYGFRISQIDKMQPETIREKILSLESSGAQQEIIINNLLHCMIELDSYAFEDILDKYLLQWGIDKTITQLIFPFLDRIGILWLTDHIRVAQEHMVSSIIREKLIMGIQNASNPWSGKKTVVMFLPQGEFHELGLLYVQYLLKVKGTKILYLSADLPFDELEFVVKFKKPDYIYTHLTSVAGRFNLEKYLDKVGVKLKDTKFVVSGRVAQSYYKKVSPNVLLKNSLNDVITELSD
ncbi:MAG: MerR family transcriptional regulator [Chitinophagaceae bacterium]|nr:MerR family transcriptional regulator [Chitinophagaceae bacterium]